ncbi:hypothetical protein M3Y97_00787500 [Aphelenchoides bicaudatus]|nr:hypothetical protein M3Y97_00787500 [Aphelenchoides bicaudatus]
MSIQITLARWYLILRYGKSKAPRYILLTLGCALVAQFLRKFYKLSKKRLNRLGSSKSKSNAPECQILSRVPRST